MPRRPSSYRSPVGAATGCEGSARAALSHRHSHDARDGQDLPHGRVLRTGSAALQARRPSPSTPCTLHQPGKPEAGRLAPTQRAPRAASPWWFPAPKHHRSSPHTQAPPPPPSHLGQNIPTPLFVQILPPVASPEVCCHGHTPARTRLHPISAALIRPHAPQVTRSTTADHRQTLGSRTSEPRPLSLRLWLLAAHVQHELPCRTKE